MISSQNVKTNQELYTALGDRVSILCSALANDEAKRDLEPIGERVLDSELAKKLDVLSMCVGRWHPARLLILTDSSDLHTIHDTVMARGKRDTKKYTGVFARPRESVRRIAGGFLNQESDKEEVRHLEAKVNRHMDEFKVRFTFAPNKCVDLSREQLSCDISNRRALEHLKVDMGKTRHLAEQTLDQTKKTEQRVEQVQEAQKKQVTNEDASA